MSEFDGDIRARLIMNSNAIEGPETAKIKVPRDHRLGYVGIAIMAVFVGVLITLSSGMICR
jgi:uncharacterized membrane protein